MTLHATRTDRASKADPFSTKISDEGDAHLESRKRSRDLSGRKIAILATDGFEKSELMEPRKALETAGAKTIVVSLKAGRIKSWDEKNWSDSIQVDEDLDSANAAEFDGLVLPGGVMNPDSLRADPRVAPFVRAFVQSEKPIAAICHGPWNLIEAGAVKGRRVTSWPSLRSDLKNAGGEWVDEEVVRDGQIVTSRKPSDLPAFNQTIVEMFAETQRRV